MKCDVYIRADGNEQIGLGHLVRCSALAHMLKDDFEITFFCLSIPSSLVQEFNICGFKVKHITDDKDFLGTISQDIIVVLDGYDFDIDYQKNIKERGAYLVYVDDLHDKEFVSDLIINHTPNASPLQYKARPYTQFALGLDFALLRPVFLDPVKKSRQFDNNGTILICFGGADPKGLTLRTLKVVVQFERFKKIIVITGAAYNKSTAFDHLITSDSRIDHRHKLNEEQMLDTMLESEVAVVPASGILYEALSAGCKVISGCAADNQKHVYENLREGKFFIDAGDFSEIILVKTFSEIQLSEKKNFSPIDGKSPLRIKKLFDLLYKETQIRLRSARIDDLELTFMWATNKSIRRYSFQQHQITAEEHLNWFNKKINDSHCLYLITELHGNPIGSLRFDINNDEAVISYLIDPKFQGQDLGLVGLKKGIATLINANIFQLNKITLISGEVMKENIASLKAFEQLGFSKTDLGEYYKFTKWAG
jgi:UDP-2,4-diacetamido-2,4,6-trideoxy-beta-L-altropyranose hydrolase